LYPNGVKKVVSVFPFGVHAETSLYELPDQLFTVVKPSSKNPMTPAPARAGLKIQQHDRKGHSFLALFPLALLRTMSRWLHSVGAFLEKLDTGDNVVDDVLAARDFAKELKDQDFHEGDDDDPPAEEEQVSTVEADSLEYPEAAVPQEEGLVAETQEAQSISTLGDHDYQTPPRKAELGESTRLPPVTNVQQYRTPAQFDEENIEASIVEASQGNILLEEAARDVAVPPVQEEDQLEGIPPASTPPTSMNAALLRELNALKAKVKMMESEKEEITKEARKLRKHMVTLNEQLEAADIELDAQRGELVKAADSLESNRKLNAATLSDTKSKHAVLVKEMEQKHAAAVTALKQQHVQQQDDLRQELLMMNNQNQQHAGSLGKRLEVLEDENSKLALERNDLLGQNRQLQSQREDLAATLEDLQNRSEQYSASEIEYENIVEKQREQIEQLTKQRHRDVQVRRSPYAMVC
jgi:hypothetical protein